MNTHKYLGLGYAASSREAAALIERAGKTGNWHDLPEVLVILRRNMHLDRAKAT